MAEKYRDHARILGIDPSTTGFGFAVLEGNNRLVDWGLATLYSKDDEELLVRIDTLVRQYTPTAIALEDVTGRKKGVRNIRRLAQVRAYMEQRGIRCVLVSRADIRFALGLAEFATKHAVAERLATAFEELACLLPPPRRPWQSEDRRMNVFDALGVVYGCQGIRRFAKMNRPGIVGGSQS